MEKQLNELQAMFPSLEMGIISLMLRESNNDGTCPCIQTVDRQS